MQKHSYTYYILADLTWLDRDDHILLHGHVSSDQRRVMDVQSQVVGYVVWTQLVRAL